MDILSTLTSGAGAIGSGLEGLGSAGLSGLERLGSSGLSGLGQLGTNFMGNMGTALTNIENTPSNLMGNLKSLGADFGFGDINDLIAQGVQTPSMKAAGFDPAAQMRSRGQTPPKDLNRLKMAMLLGGLSGGMGGGGGNVQQLLPLLMLMQQLQGKMP